MERVCGPVRSPQPRSHDRTRSDISALSDFTDGPYVETKEHLGGFTVVDVSDDEAARHWAGRLAVSLDWPQEVHRFPSSVVEIIERQSQESE